MRARHLPDHGEPAAAGGRPVREGDAVGELARGTSGRRHLRHHRPAPRGRSARASRPRGGRRAAPGGDAAGVGDGGGPQVQLGRRCRPIARCRRCRRRGRSARRPPSRGGRSRGGRWAAWSRCARPGMPAIRRRHDRDRHRAEAPARWRGGAREKGAGRPTAGSRLGQRPGRARPRRSDQRNGRTRSTVTGQTCCASRLVPAGDEGDPGRGDGHVGHLALVEGRPHHLSNSSLCTSTSFVVRLGHDHRPQGTRRRRIGRSAKHDVIPVNRLSTNGR